MSEQQLRDKTGRLIGTIRTLPNGKTEIRDSSSRLKGTYDPQTNQTRDASTRLVGTGNMLTTLLRD